MCEGREHILFAQFLALLLAGRHAPGLAYLHVPPATAPAALLATAYLSGGSGPLNDLDKRRTTASESLGPVTELLARGVNKVSGGHRWGTHNLVAPFVFTAGVWIAGYYRHDWWGVALLSAYLAIILISGLEFFNWHKNKHRAHAEYAAIAVAAGLAAAMAVTGRGLFLVPTAVTVGTASHVILDWFTDKGEHLAVPLSRRAFRCWVHFTTGEGFETKVLRPGLIAAIGVALLPLIGIHLHIIGFLAGRTQL